VDQRSKDRGRDAEERAARHLAAKGYEILARNLRTKSGEIDVVARDGVTLVMVEVRYRRHVFGAWKSLSPDKLRSLRAAGREAQAALRVPRSTPLRFDVVLCGESGSIVHLRGAVSPWRP
jgi:putative endonuclease